MGSRNIPKEKRIVNARELAKNLSNKMEGLSEKKARDIVNFLFDDMKAHILNDSVISIHEFAKFRLKDIPGGTFRSTGDINKSKIQGIVTYAPSKMALCLFSPKLKNIIKLNYRTHEPKILQ